MNGKGLSELSIMVEPRWSQDDAARKEEKAERAFTPAAEEGSRNLPCLNFNETVRRQRDETDLTIASPPRTKLKRENLEFAAENTTNTKQYQFQWIESPNSNGEPRVRDSPRQQIFHGKSLLPADDSFPFIIHAKDTLLQTTPSRRLSLCVKPPTNMIPSPPPPRRPEGAEPPPPHMALFGLLWPNTSIEKDQ